MIHSHVLHVSIPKNEKQVQKIHKISWIFLCKHRLYFSFICEIKREKGRMFYCEIICWTRPWISIFIDFTIFLGSKNPWNFSFNLSYPSESIFMFGNWLISRSLVLLCLHFYFFFLNYSWCFKTWQKIIKTFQFGIWRLGKVLKSLDYRIWIMYF